jgi:AcrR family transcriptional regulator
MGRTAGKDGTARNHAIAVERKAGTRLSRRDWILAGQEILREHGVSGVKLAQLTRRLSVSTGSFYHHFSNFDEYLGATAEAYSVDRVQGVLDRARAASEDPVGRIRALARLSLDDHTFELDRAMRIWAAMDERAQTTVRNAEELVLAFLTEAFRNLGFGATEARLRAGVLLSVNIMPLSIQDPKFRRSLFKGTLQLLTGQPAG